MIIFLNDHLNHEIFFNTKKQMSNLLFVWRKKLKSELAKYVLIGIRVLAAKLSLSNLLYEKNIVIIYKYIYFLTVYAFGSVKKIAVCFTKDYIYKVYIFMYIAMLNCNVCIPLHTMHF